MMSALHTNSLVVRRDIPAGRPRLFVSESRSFVASLSLSPSPSPLPSFSIYACRFGCFAVIVVGAAACPDNQPRAAGRRVACRCLLPGRRRRDLESMNNFDGAFQDLVT